MSFSFRTNGNFIDFVHTDNTSLAVESTIKSLHNTSRCIDWSLPEDTTRISFTIDEVKYSNIPISDIDFDGTVMNSQDDFETGIEAMFPGLAGSAGGAGLLSETVTLTDAQIKAVGGTPFELVAAQAGKILNPISCVFTLDSTAGIYTGITSSSLWLEVGNQNLCSSGLSTCLEESAGIYTNNMIPNLSQASAQNLDNQSIKLVSPVGGAFTGGNAANTLKVTVYYVVVDL
jgi:hypothetical protein